MPHSEYVLLNKDGKVPYSALLNNPNVPGPTIQALNLAFIPYPLPAVTHSETVSSEPSYIDVPLPMLDEVEVQPAQMGKPMTGEWAYKWEKDWEVAIQKDGGVYLIQHRWVKTIATDLQSVALCVKDVQRHPLFIKGSPIPPALNSVLLFRQDFGSLCQVTSLIRLAQISFGMSMAFVNAW
ncbi:uncharacterized protein ARMOST_10215 [Armillaria ostoyae]|uniref:Uncharacterized protein n=1 Tax=Armillaria ostoyae TaxID=47428 RepID=A0A284RDP4_ARMOS|nr:uncharacterized protein ARMOST_10215 [Armillaria ostoyae]